MTQQFIGRPLPRVDGRAKVTGTARYAADFNQPDQVYGVIVSATVGLFMWLTNGSTAHTQTVASSSR